MDNSKETSPLRVLIIGAGSAGLLTAHIFEKAGITATVFEKDESPTARPRDWNFGIYWAQSRLAEIISAELNAQLDSVQTDPSHVRSPDSIVPIYHGVTGELLKALPAPYSIRLQRRAWLDLIRKDVHVQFGKSLHSLTTTPTGVTATFTDGTVEEGTLIIGAEGAHSVTRQFLFSSSPQEGELLSSPIVAFVTITTVSHDTAIEIRKLHPTYCMSMEPDGRFVWANIHDCSSPDPSRWKFMIIMTWRSDTDPAILKEKGDDAILDDLKKRAQGLASPFRESFETIPDGTKVWHARLTYWPTRPWDSRGGKVTLVGDAAHPMTFHRGQGLGNAITDVAELQTRLQSMREQTAAELGRAVQEYEKEMWPRGLEAVMENLENTIAIHDWETLRKSPIFVKGVEKRDSDQPGTYVSG